MQKWVAKDQQNSKHALPAGSYADWASVNDGNANELLCPGIVTLCSTIPALSCIYTTTL